MKLAIQLQGGAVVLITTVFAVAAVEERHAATVRQARLARAMGMNWSLSERKK